KGGLRLRIGIIAVRAHHLPFESLAKASRLFEPADLAAVNAKLVKRTTEFVKGRQAAVLVLGEGFHVQNQTRTIRHLVTIRECTYFSTNHSKMFSIQRFARPRARLRRESPADSRHGRDLDAATQRPQLPRVQRSWL